MKQIKQIITSLVIVLSLVAIPTVAFAQADPDVPSVEVGTSDIDSETPTTEAPTDSAGVPETGIAPAPSRLLRNVEIFLIGGTVGGLLGYGAITLKKKSRQDL